MDSVRHRRSGAALYALAFACWGLAFAASGGGALADSGQARDMAVGGSWPWGMSRAAGALRAGAPEVRTPAAAMLEGCVTAANPLERSATFVGRMTSVPGSASMAMRIGVEEHTAGVRGFHSLEGPSTPAIGAWRISEPGVKIFKDLKQVTNLSAAADYRGVVHFRWTNAKGAVIKREVLRTAACHQPAPEGQVGSEGATARMPSR
jgi:hypothetical protein